MQAGVGLLVMDVMPVYMIMPRYSHNYSLFYQLLNSNLFTHRNTYAFLREATTETYGQSYKFPICFILQSLLSIYIIKIPKIFILLLLSLSYLTLASGREGIDNPFIALVARFLFVCVGTTRLACGLLLDWYLGSQKLREILTLLCCIIPSSSGKSNASSRGSKNNFWRRCRGDLCQVKIYQVPITSLILRITLFAICLSFSSPSLHHCRFICPLFRLPLFRLLRRYG